MKKRKCITASTEIQNIIRDYYRQLSANKMDKLRKNWQILRKVQPSKTGLGRTENMNRKITSNKIETVIKNLPTNESPDLMASPENPIKHLEKG